MKKKIINILVIIGLIFLKIDTVFAEKVTVTVTPRDTFSENGGIGYYTNGNTSNPLNAGGAAIAKFSDGNTGYCIDPGGNIPTSGMTCTKTSYSSDSKDYAMLASILTSGASDEVIGLAIRNAKYYKGDILSDNYNINCAYIKTLYDSATEAKKAELLNQYPDYLKSDSKCITTIKPKANDSFKTSDGVSVVSAASTLLTNSMNDTTPIGTGHTFEVKEEKGKVIFSVKVPDGVTDAKLSISGNNIKGNTGDFSIEGGKTANFTIETDSAGASCGTYTANLTYTGNSNSCNKIVKYNCGSEIQNFIACDDVSGDSGKVNDSKKGNVPCKDKEDCKQTPTAGPSNYGGDALCDANGSDTVVWVYEENEYTKDVENCLVDSEDINNTSLEATDFFGVESDYCKIYCTENYEFYAPGLLSSDDYSDGKWNITSGSSFTFLNTSVKDKTDTYCYVDINIDALLNDVTNAANKYAKTIADVETSCQYLYDENGDFEYGIKSQEKVWYETNALTQGNLKVNFNNRKSEQISQETFYNASDCTNGTEKVSSSVKTAAQNTYEADVKKYITDFNKCTDTTNNFNMEKVSKCAEPTIEFIYGTGNYTDVSTTLDLVKETTNPSYSTPSYSGASSKVNINLGIGKSSDEFYNTDHMTGSISVEYEYDISGDGICNNYNTGESITGVSEAECRAKEGTTYTKGWPIPYESTYATYYYRFNVTNYGHDFSSGTCENGRLYEVAQKLGLNKDYSMKCPFGVNGCNDCEWECDPDDYGCNFDDENCDEDCIWECKEVGCLFDINNGLAINYTPISLINLFNEESISYLNDQHKNAIAIATNKDKNNDSTVAVASGTKEGIANNWNNSKGIATKTRISDLGETIYKENLEYRIELTPALINEIKAYNSSEISNGGYLNSKLECKNKDNDDDYVICKSKFLKKYLGIDTPESNFIKYGEQVGNSSDIKRKSGIGPAWK